MKIRLCLALCLILGACGKKEETHLLKIAATPLPQAQILQFIQPKLRSEYGINLKIIEVDDYNIPNRALSEKEVAVNYFQHLPFMKEQIKNFGYKIRCYARIHIEPMAIYSKKIQSLKDIKEGASIAIPNDPTNEYRALALLEKEGLITLRPSSGSLTATVIDIESNPKSFKFHQIDAAVLPRSLKDVDIAAIPTNFAMQAGLNPRKDALAIESIDSPYANILAIVDGTEDDPKLEALKKVILSQDVRTFIIKTYKGAIIPILEECKNDKILPSM